MPNNVAVEFTVGQRDGVEAEYTVNESQAIDTEFTIRALPMKVSQLENDLDYQTKDEVDTALEDKQDVLTAGAGITIEDNVISATGAQAVWGLITGDIDDQTDLKEALDAKQDVISDLSEIRSGAALGATAVQSVTTGTVNGTIKVDGNAVSVYGLGSAAYTASTAYDASGSASTAETNAKNYADSLSSNYATAEQGALADTAVQPADLATVATSGSYNDLLNKPTIPDTTYMATTNTDQTISGDKTFTGTTKIPAGRTYITNVYGTTNLGYWTSDIDGGSNITFQTMTASTRDINFKTNNGGKLTYNGSEVALASNIPTVNNATLTIQKNGTDVQTFTANASTNATANITVPTDTGDLTNGAGFITNSALSGYLQNNATGVNALAVGDSSQSTAEGGVAVGDGARANSTYSVAVGQDTRATNTNTTVIGRAAKATQARAIAIGSGAEANAQDAIALKGINNTANTFQVYTYPMLDMSNGLIPDARISTNIARSADIPSLAGYATETWVGQQGYITGITSGDVTTALGYTPYSSANPNGYTSNVGTVTSVNNTSPDGNGNVTLSIPTVNDATITITQGGVTKGSFSLNQASGDTIALDAGGGGSYTAGTGIDITSDVISVTAPTLTNTATGTNALTIAGTASTYAGATNVGKLTSAGSYCTSIGFGASATGSDTLALGCGASASGSYSKAIGDGAHCSGNHSTQLGYGTNSEANSFYVSTSSSNNWKMLGSDGLIPAARLPIATSVSSSSTNSETVGAKLFYDTCGDIETLINAL